MCLVQALTLLDYLAKTGSERVAQQCRENAFTIQTLRDFQYVDRDGRDQGVNVREKAKQLVALLRDEDRLRLERAQALKTKERMAGSGVPPSYPSRRSSQPSMAALYGEEFNHSRGSPSSFNCESSCMTNSQLKALFIYKAQLKNHKYTSPALKSVVTAASVMCCCLMRRVTPYV